ncbi:hypothetical protein OsccyDRAFT_4079 [Leptolyngbyaceae cyanobacterium JSC-12]|nr:hypothetical protein OsccyDRAFT_4079 [Leptolyngbyaceae cyanobacterium JSC-12]
MICYLICLQIFIIHLRMSQKAITPQQRLLFPLYRNTSLLSVYTFYIEFRFSAIAARCRNPSHQENLE